VSSVPYWDERCGAKFVDVAGFEAGWQNFWGGCAAGAFDPRGYVLDSLTLEQRALQYYEIARSIVRQPAAQTSEEPGDGLSTGLSPDLEPPRRQQVS
jgi:hypothetical protein